MPRRRIPRPDPPRTPRVAFEERVEVRGGTPWRVRDHRGSAKSYICPGCLQSIGPQTRHVVVWSDQKSLIGGDAIEDRRHWHTACWKRAT